MAAEKKIFKPLSRVLVDAVLITDLIVMISFSADRTEMRRVIAFAFVINAVEIFFWYLILKNLFRIQISEDEISGPAPWLYRVAIPLKKLDKKKFEDRKRTSNWYRDLWTEDGKRIRLWRILLGRRQTFKVIDALGWGPPAGSKAVMPFYPGYPSDKKI